MNVFNQNYFQGSKIVRLSQKFRSASPFKSLVLDNFLDPEFVEYLYNKFPTNKGGARIDFSEFNFNQSDVDFHEKFKALKEAMRSETFYEWLTQITGISNLFMTNDHLGSGLRDDLNGTSEEIHLDPCIHPTLHLYRRLNIQIYLQKEWKAEYKGDLEFWNADGICCEKYISPVFNRFVLFETNDCSYYGSPKKTDFPKGITRKLFYGSYFTRESQTLSISKDIFPKSLAKKGSFRKNLSKSKRKDDIDKDLI
jgi:hypothetical protein